MGYLLPPKLPTIKNFGTTLLELLVAMLVTGALFMLAIPAMQTWVEKTKVDKEVDLFVSQLALARHTAISKGIHVSMCPLDQQAPNRCGKRNTWHLGTLIFEDLNANQKVDSKDVILQRSSPLAASEVFWRAFRNRSYLVFTPWGLTEWQNGHFLFCPQSSDNPQLARALTLNHAGRTYRSKDRNDDGIHENRRGKNLEC